MFTVPDTEKYKFMGTDGGKLNNKKPGQSIGFTRALWVGNGG